MVPVNSPALGLGQIYGTRQVFPPFNGPQIQSESHCYSHYIHSTNVLRVILSHSNLYFSLQGWQMVKTIDNLPSTLPVVY